jgi:Glyceraldehyde-3-phosphate dehydrogenase/erythrose-4-phosphate dehydrogenase
VSIVDFAVNLRDETTAVAINDAFRAAAAGPLKGILGVSDEPLVSMDFKGDSRSSIVDSALTMVIGGTGTFAKVLSWYDNEWGYSSRVADLTKFIAERL